MPSTFGLSLSLAGVLCLSQCSRKKKILRKISTSDRIALLKLPKHGIRQPAFVPTLQSIDKQCVILRYGTIPYDESIRGFNSGHIVGELIRATHFIVGYEEN